MKRGILCSVEIHGDGADVPADGWYQIGVVGEWKGHRGQPGGFALSVEDLASIEEYFNRRYLENGVDLVVDYNHQSSVAKYTGRKAPAAGWIDRMERRAGGRELWAHVKWLDEARGLLQQRAYRYLSPVFVPRWPDPVTGKFWRFVSTAVSLVNQPFLTELPAVVNASDTAPGGMTSVAPGQEGGMDLLKMLAMALGQELAAVAELLGVAPEASNEDVAKAVAGKLTAGVENSAAAAGLVELCNSLDVDPKATAEERKARAKALRDASTGVVVIANSIGMEATATPAQIVAKIRELATAQQEDKALVLIENAIEGRKVAPANREQFLALARADYEAMAELLNSLPEILAAPSAAGGKKTPTTGEAQDPAVAFENSLELQEEFGSVETYKAYLEAEKAGRVVVVKGAK
jgi:phage I-like protein